MSTRFFRLAAAVFAACAVCQFPVVAPTIARAAQPDAGSGPIDPATCNCFVELQRQTAFAPAVDEQGVPTPVAKNDAAMIKARQYFFGAVNVDGASGAVRADRVILTWINNTGWAAAINGHVLLWGAYLIDPDGLTPTDLYQMAALRPEYLFVGHGHNDHAPDAGRILYESPTTKLVGTPEHCDQVNAAMKAAVAPANPGQPDCIFAVTRADPKSNCGQGSISQYIGVCGELFHHDDLIPGVNITVFRHPHSAAGTAPIPNDPVCPGACLPVFLSGAEPQVPKMVTQRNNGVPQGNGDMGGSLVWQFHVATPKGSMTVAWNDSAGPNVVGDLTWKAVRALPYDTDLQIGSLATFDYSTTGWRDGLTMVAAMHPRLFIPQHLEGLAGLQGLQTVNSGSFKTSFDLQASMTFPVTIDGLKVQRPGEIWPNSTSEYLRPFVFDPAAIEPPRGSSAVTPPATGGPTNLPNTSATLAVWPAFVVAAALGLLFARRRRTA